MNDSKCRICNKNFLKQPNVPKQYLCSKSCRIIQNRKRANTYRLNNLDKIRKYHKSYRAKNKEKLREQGREYRNRPEIKERLRLKYLNRDKDKKRQSDRRYYQKNATTIKEKVRKYGFVYRKTERHKHVRRIYYKNRLMKDMQFIIKSRLRARMRMAFKRYVQDGFIPKKYNYIDWKRVLAHLKETAPANWRECHIDHIKPVSSFDLTKKDNLRKVNDPKNLMWLNGIENLKKNKFVYSE